MLTQDSIYVILFSLPIYQLLFYTVQLVTFRKSSPSRRYFGFLMFLMTLFLVLNASYHLGYRDLFSWWYIVYVPVLLSIAPVFFLYILSLTREDHDISPRSKLQFFIPPVMVFILNVIFYGMLPESSRLTFIDQGFTAGNTGVTGRSLTERIFWTGSVMLLVLQVVLIAYQVRKILKAEAMTMRQRPAYLAYLDLNWVMIISLSVLLFLIFNGMVNFFGQGRTIGFALVYNVLMLISGGLAGYYGMKQNSMLMQVSRMTVPADVSGSSDKNALSENPPANKLVDFIHPEDIERISLEITRIMEEKKPFLNAAFSMGDLCALLNESRRKVTYVINVHMEKNFYGIVNDYRIKEAVDKLSGDKNNNLKIEAIAEMVEFQSKSSFNACFKKYTGQTPSAFKASQSGEKAEQA